MKLHCPLWSTNRCDALLKALLEATRVAYFQYITIILVPITAEADAADRISSD